MTTELTGTAGQAPTNDPWVDALPQAILLSEGGLVTRVNAAAVRLWGVPQDRALGRPVLEIVRRHTLEALIDRGGELELEAGGRTLRCTAVRHAQSSSLIVEDITEHRRREAELREATAVLSHEFRTPVAALRGVLEALEYDMPTDLAQNFVKQGLQETERLARLVEDLAVGFRPTRARTLPLSEAFTRAERLLSTELATRQAQLSFGQDHLVRADPDKLLQVLLNLIENALKYGPHGQPVEVQTSLRGTWVEVRVLDQGAPIPDTDSLFRAHTRGQQATGQGSGMGLYIVRSIVHGWGGQAWAERQENGNAFCFTLPGVSGLG
ncbi:ATP-binding protein [Deinococcus deserti]|uniref:histidine kinase n=1 Tax=Deinococcus deserti (strain DSM 17065 / CIP 109153 / LMG 22923 / VCD115) TaxID=546414 RepID=C1CY27_DEIDV|nr:ATP-binding protein [Deinococcus deserti]ACO46983.1 putative histidine kinase, classic [Deinococcus deserti VCD115]